MFYQYFTESNDRFCFHWDDFWSLHRKMRIKSINSTMISVYFFQMDDKGVKLPALFFLPALMDN